MRGGDLFSPGGGLLFGEGAASRPRGRVKGGGKSLGMCPVASVSPKASGCGVAPMPWLRACPNSWGHPGGFWDAARETPALDVPGGCWSQPRAREIPAGLKSGPKTVPATLGMGLGGFGGPQRCRWGWRRRSPAEWGGGKVGDLKCLCSAEEKSSLLEGGCLVGWILVPDPRCCVRVWA